MKNGNRKLPVFLIMLFIIAISLVPNYAATKTFTKYVDSRICSWQSTGIQVATGDELTFNATGQVVYWKSADGTQKKYCGPDGSGPGACSGDEPCCLAPGLGDNALVGKIGSGSPFYIGSSKTITANISGTLYLGMNETVHCGGCADNEGSWTVHITQSHTVPSLSRSPSKLDFGTSSTSKTFSVWNSDGGTLNYTISASPSWISVSPASGSSTGEHGTITVTVNRSRLPAEHYTGIVTINSNGGRQVVWVAMDVPALTPNHCATNQAPNIPTLISPTNSETAPFPPKLKLEWKCSDPDGDPLTYKVYLHWDYSELSTAYKDPEKLAKYLVATTTDTTWAPSGVPIRNAKYYWLVIASDGCSETKSPIFSFRAASRAAPPYNYCWSGEGTPPTGTGHAEHSCFASTGVLAAGAASTVIGASSSTSQVVMGAYVQKGTVPVSISIRGVYGSIKALTNFAEGLILWDVYGPVQDDGTAKFVISGHKYLESPVSLEDFVSIGIAAAGLKTGADIFEGLRAIVDWVTFSSSLQEANNRLDRLQDSDLWNSYSANFSFQAPKSGVYVIAVGIRVRSTAAIGAGKVFFLGQVDSITVGR